MVGKIPKIKYFLQLGGNPLLIYPFGLGAKRLCDSPSAETWVTWVWLISAETWVTWVWLISAETWVTWVWLIFGRDMSRIFYDPSCPVCISISFVSHWFLGCGYYRFCLCLLFFGMVATYCDGHHVWVWLSVIVFFGWLRNALYVCHFFLGTLFLGEICLFVCDL